MPTRYTLFGLTLAACVLVGAWMLARDISPKPPSEEVIRIEGSSTMVPLMEDIAKRFQSLHPEARIVVASQGSQAGIAALREGRVQIAMLSRGLDAQEGDLRAFPIARDGVCLVVHPDNPVDSLPLASIGAIVTGHMTQWSTVGGEDEPIRFISKGPECSDSQVLATYLHMPVDDISHACLIRKTGTCLKTVADDRNAVAVVSVGVAERAQTGVKLVKTNGVPASSRMVRQGEYPLARPLVLVTRDVPQGLADRLIQFALSSNVTDLIERHRFVPYLD